MFDHYSIGPLAALFLASAAIIWIAGVKLSDTTDILSARFGLGEALGGVILLAVATNLPELAITASAAWSGQLEIAVGNILGGIAIQTVVLVLLDSFGMKGEARPLTYRAASLTLVIEGVLVIAILIVAVMATQLPASLVYARLTPDAVLIALFWGAGIWLIGRANRGLPWHDSAGNAPDGQAKPKGHSKQPKGGKSARPGSGRAILVFAAAAAATLVAGVTIEESGSVLARHIGMSGVLFGATILAAATALPELSTGLTSTRLQDYQLAISDIFGGNAFLPVLFLLATLVSGKAVLPHAQATDIYLAALGILLTCIYLAGLIFRPGRRILGMGIDSLAVLILYVVGLGGLIAVAQRSAGS
jgi:cation:H+ antiporter